MSKGFYWFFGVIFLVSCFFGPGFVETLAAVVVGALSGFVLAFME